MHDPLDATEGAWSHETDAQGTQRIVAAAPRGKVELAVVLLPIPEKAAFDSSTGEVEVVGDHEQNAKLMASSKRLHGTLLAMTREISHEIGKNNTALPDSLVHLYQEALGVLRPLEPDHLGEELLDRIRKA